MIRELKISGILKRAIRLAVIALSCLLMEVLQAQIPYPDVYYDFDETGAGNDTLICDRMGRYDAVRQLNYLWAPSDGKYKGSLQFNGNTEVDLAPADVNHIFNSGYREKTVAFWFRTAQPAANQMVYFDGPGNSNMGIRLLQGNLEGVVNAGNDIYSPALKLVQVPFNSTEWAHVALVFDNGNIRLYLNGKLGATEDLAIDTVIRTQQRPARLGYKPSGWSPFRDLGIGATAEYNFNGKMDDFTLYMRALDSTDIALLMQGDSTTVAPRAPENLTAEAKAYNHVSVSWEDRSGNEIGYRILSSEDGGEYSSVGETDRNTTSFQHRPARPETGYSYKVLAFNLWGPSDTAESAIVTTPAAPPLPAAPTDFKADTIMDRQINLSWQDQSDNEEGFTILISTGGGPYESRTVGEGVTNYSHTGLIPETSYSYKLFAFHAGGNSDTLSLGPLTTPHQPILEGISFPYDAGVVNVREDYGAYGDGIHDDTEALQNALNTNTGIIYLPDGTYLISEKLIWPDPARNITLQGQSAEGTMIRLKDSCDGFVFAPLPTAMIWTGQRPAQRFRNYIRDLTIHSGNLNPGAIGMQFIANNAGGVFDVKIISGDGQGKIGLDLGYTDEQGPCLIKNVSVSGFNIGISSKHSVDGIVFENIHLEGQQQYGFINSGQCVSIRGLHSIDTVTAFYNQSQSSVATFVDCQLLGGSASVPAVRNEGALFARNLSTEGYQKAIASTTATGDAGGPNVEEYISHAANSLWQVKQQSLNLPIKETPEVPWDNDFRNWANVQEYGATPDGESGTDDTEAIQAALNSGKTTVYFPTGTYRMDGPVSIGGNVRRVFGCESRVMLPENTQPAFTLIEGTYDTVVFERFAHFGYNSHITIDNVSARTLVALNNSAFNGNITGPGDVFIEDIVANVLGQWKFGNQSVWARQFDVESRDGLTHVTNDGGKLWILGFKTENKGILIETKGGGKTELLGGLNYSVGADYPGAMFVNDNSDISITIGEANYGGSAYQVIVSENQNGEWKTLELGDTPARGAASMIPLYIGIHMEEYPTLVEQPGSRDQSEDPELRMYPLPAEDELLIEFRDAASAWEEINVYNLTGSCVLVRRNEGRQERIHLDISGLARGLYLLRDGTSARGEQGRFIKW